MIELRDIQKTFENNIALNGINLFIQESEIFGIIGKSGAGKSTLLRCINMLERPDCGDVIVDGETLTQLPPKKLRIARHKTAMIFQHFNLLQSKTVYDNIALPMRIQKIDEKSIQEKIYELLDLVELTDKMNAYPNQLSGGQKQRVAIARGLSCSPKILLCDEATSALDPKSTASILALLKRINQIYGITIVLITHEMEVIKRICHRLALIESGSITEVAGLSTVFLNKASIARGMLFQQLNQDLPACLANKILSTPNDKPLLRLFYYGDETTTPFISQTSRDLNIDINILLANIDRYDTLTCGTLVIELQANFKLLAEFIKRCEKHDLTVEILGYVYDDVV